MCWSPGPCIAVPRPTGCDWTGGILPTEGVIHSWVNGQQIPRVACKWLCYQQEFSRHRKAPRCDFDLGPTHLQNYDKETGTPPCPPTGLGEAQPGHRLCGSRDGSAGNWIGSRDSSRYSAIQDASVTGRGLTHCPTMPAPVIEHYLNDMCHAEKRRRSPKCLLGSLHSQ